MYVCTYVYIHVLYMYTHYIIYYLSYIICFIYFILYIIYYILHIIYIDRCLYVYIHIYIHTTTNTPFCTTEMYPHYLFFVHECSSFDVTAPGDVLFARLHRGRGGLFSLLHRRGDRGVHVIYLHDEA